MNGTILKVAEVFVAAAMDAGVRRFVFSSVSHPVLRLTLAAILGRPPRTLRAFFEELASWEKFATASTAP
jgi:hypothetical protein